MLLTPLDARGCDPKDSGERVKPPSFKAMLGRPKKNKWKRRISGRRTRMKYREVSWGKCPNEVSTIDGKLDTIRDLAKHLLNNKQIYVARDGTGAVQGGGTTTTQRGESSFPDKGRPSNLSGRERS